MLPSFATETVVRIRPTLVDDGRGSMVPDPSGAGERMPIPGCSVQPGATSEFLVGRDATNIRWTVLAPPGADVAEHDLIEHAGVTYDVAGHPFPWRSPTGALDHTVVLLSTWTG